MSFLMGRVGKTFLKPARYLRPPLAQKYNVLFSSFLLSSSLCLPLGAPAPAACHRQVGLNVGRVATCFGMEQSTAGAQPLAGRCLRILGKSFFLFSLTPTAGILLLLFLGRGRRDCETLMKAVSFFLESFAQGRT